MKSYDELTKELLERRDQYVTLQKEKKQKIKRIATPLCCFLLVGLLVLGVWQGGLYQTQLPIQSPEEDSHQGTQEENQSSSPSVVSKESHVNKPSNPSQSSNSEKSSIVSKPLVESKDSVSSKVPVSGQQEQTDTSSESALQKPVPTFSIERPSPGYFFVTDEESPDAMDRPMADKKPYTPPSFATVKAFHNWLQNGGTREAERNTLLSLAKNSPTVTLTSYYRPQLRNGKNNWQLTNINVNRSWLYYNYTLTVHKEKTNLGIYIGVSEGRINELSYERQLCYELSNGPVENWTPAFDRYGSATVKGVEYTCYYFPDDKVTSVYWETNGITFCAVYDGEYSDVGKILPLLEMEQVNYKIASSGTTKK